MITVREYCSPSGARAERNTGQWAYQLAVDTIAYAQNMPVRILLMERLRQLPQVIEDIVESDAGKKLLAESQAASICDRVKLFDPSVLNSGAQWLVAQGSGVKLDNSDLIDGWYSAMLLLLPHVERRIWLTEMGNPHPAHALTRMLDHWSMFVLMWCYIKREELVSETSFSIDKALGIKGYSLRLGPKFELDKYDGGQHACRLVIGPFWASDNVSTGKEQEQEHSVQKNLEDRFFSFVDALGTMPEWRDDIYHRAPSKQEIHDALVSRVILTQPEVKLRADSCHRAFTEHFLAVQLADSVVECIGRNDWEQIAMLSSWLAHWQQFLQTQAQSSGNVLHIWASAAQSSGISMRWDFGHWHLKYLQQSPAGVQTPQQLNDNWSNGIHIDLPSVYWNRTQERQNAAWTAQIVAINNLLHTHAGNDPGPADAYKAKSQNEKATFEAANHLLRGFGGRICHYLLSIARADSANIYWLNYAQDPPRLVHAGGYMRLLEHRVDRQEIHSNFDRWAWKQAPENAGDIRKFSDDCEANKWDKSASQAYRVAATGKEDIPENPNDTVAYFDNFERYKPKSGIAFPLLVNQRVVGVLTLAGLCDRQFCQRLALPMHRVAGLIGQAMHQTSLLWQMRQLTDFFTRTPYRELKEFSADNRFNPLRTVSRCLTNIFLCRAVHIWLQKEDEPESHQLYGYNLNIFDKLTYALSLKMPLVDEENKIPVQNVMKQQHSVERAFLAFASDIALINSKGKSNPNLVIPQFYQILQGRLNVDIEKTNYNLEQAINGMPIGNDFVYPPKEYASGRHDHGDFRSIFFKEHRLYDLAMFGLIVTLPGSQPKLVGGITLHDIAVAGLNLRHESPRPWPVAWQGVVAHVQTYLPNLLSQVEILDKPLDQTRRFLLHEGRAELMNVRNLLHVLHDTEARVLAPDSLVRRIVRQYKPLETAEVLEKQLGAAWQALRDLNSGRQMDNLVFLTTAISRQRELSDLDIELAAGQDYVDIQESIEKALEPRREELRRRGVHSSIEGFERTVELWVRPIWWNRILTNLVENASKYAHERFEVRWIPEYRLLRFTNVATYSPSEDHPELLFMWGKRGSAAKFFHLNDEVPSGHGYGLWGAKFMCELEGLALKLQIQPQTRPLKFINNEPVPGARYIFDIQIPRGGRLR